MIKIAYPSNAAALATFQKKYIDTLIEFLDGFPEVNTTLANIIVSGKPLTWEYLVTAPFEELKDLHKKIKKISQKGNIKRLRPLTQYAMLQPKIAKFFMAQEDVKMSTCFYCNIDTIFSFSEIGDYVDGIDFIQRANVHQLEKLKNVGPKAAEKIIAARKRQQFTKLSDCPGSKKVMNSLITFDRTLTHNHFTIDHFYSKKNSPYLSLCLYNFVPSCYACNSKFKKTGKAYAGSALNSSPSSNSFSFQNEARFSVFYHRACNTVSTITDFSVDITISNNQKTHEAYINLFKLHGRYFLFKKEALKLIHLKFQYPDTIIGEMADRAGISTDEMKRLIFGRELFEADSDQDSLVKYKRDIARNIDIIT